MPPSGTFRFWRENFGGKILEGKFWRENFGGKILEGKTDASLVSWSWFGLG
jgi:hypothetical protein